MLSTWLPSVFQNPYSPFLLFSYTLIDHFSVFSFRSVSSSSFSSKHFEQEKEDTTKMQRCGSSYCNPVGPCSCCNNDHLYHHHHTTTTTTSHANSFSMLFSMPNHHQYHNHKTTFDAYHGHPMIMTTSPSSSSSSSSVDCTLSLSTPSSTNAHHHHHHRKSNISSKLCGWNIFQSTSSNKHKKPPTTTATAANNKLNSRGGGGNSDSGLTSRRCANCDTTSTPLWRNGPKGPKSLCNACGIRYKKEERRATNTTNGSEVASAMSMEPQEQQQHYSWTTQHSQQTHMMPSTCPVTEFRFIEDDDRQYSSYTNSSNSTSTGGGAANVPFLSWRLNVPERQSGLVHDYI